MNLKKLSLFFLALSSLILASCETKKGNFDLFLDAKPVLSVGKCEVYTLDFKTEKRAQEGLNTLLSSLVTGFDQEGNVTDYIYQVVGEMVFPYSDTEYGDWKDYWAAWVEYECRGIEVSTYIAAPVTLASSGEFKADIVESLLTSGHKVIAIDEEKLYTDDGIFVLYTFYYHRESELGLTTAALEVSREFKEMRENFSRAKKDFIKMKSPKN